MLASSLLWPVRKLFERARNVSLMRLCIVVAAALLTLHALFCSSLLGFDAVDDAYISYRYAHNAARGHGLTFNVGERRVEGYTNFLWTVMMIPAFWLRLPVHIVAIALGLAWSLGCVALIGSEARDGRWGMAIAALLIAADGSFALWSVGGLESPLFAFLVLGGVLAYLREMDDPHCVPLSGAWFALAAMARPEGVLVYGLTGVHHCLTRLIRERRVAAVQDWRRLGLFVLIWGPWFAFRWRYYGYPFPNTFYAKVTLGDSGAQRERGMAYLQTFLQLHLAYLTLPLGVLALLSHRQVVAGGDDDAWRRGQLLRQSYFALLVVGYSAYIVYVGGDWSVGRFFVPILPPFYMLVGDGLDAVRRWIINRAPDLRRVVGVVVGGAVVGLAFGLFLNSSLGGEKALFLDRFNARQVGEARVTLGKWLHDNFAPDTYIAVDAAGQIPFYSDLRTLDLFGLNDLNIAHRRVERMGKGTPGHEKMDMNYVIFDARPDYIIIYGTAFDWLAAYGYERVDLPWTERDDLRPLLGIYARQGH